MGAFNNKHLLTGSKGNKINCFPRDQSLSDCYKTGNFESGNSLDLPMTTVVGQHSRVTVQCCLLRNFSHRSYSSKVQ